MSNSMQLRPMVISDYENVFHLWSATQGMGIRSLDDSKEGIERFLLRNQSTNFVAIINNTIIGVILCGHDGRRGYIYHMAVEESNRGQSIGRSLLQLAMESLKREGIHKAALVVYDDNANGNEFWEKVGFKKRDDLIYRNKSLNSNNR